MEGTAKAVLWIVVGLLVLGGIYYWYTTMRTGIPNPQTSSQAANNTPASNVPILASGTGTSDAALAQDLSGVDNHMSMMAADTAAIDSGMNDTPVPQAQ